MKREETRIILGLRLGTQSTSQALHVGPAANDYLGKLAVTPPTPVWGFKNGENC